MISFVNAAYPCFERNGVPTCPGFWRKPNFDEEIRKVDTIARVNEAVPQSLDLEVGGKIYSVRENWDE